MVPLDSPSFWQMRVGEGEPTRWSYQVYNCFTLVLSCVVLCCVCVMHQVSRTASVLPHAFRMLRLHRRRLYCFEVDISSGAPARKVRMQYIWVLRTTLLVVACYIWQTCVLTFWAVDMRHDTLGTEKLANACVTRQADCFGMPHNYDFFSVNATPENLCTKFPNLKKLFQLPQLNGDREDENQPSEELTDDRQRRKWIWVDATGREWNQEDFLSKYRYVTCVTFAKPDTIAATQHLCIAFALGNMIVTLFEVLVWLLYRARSSWLPLLVLLVGILFLAVWVGSIFIPQLLTFFSSWIGYVMLLSTPVILWTALLAAHNLRKIQHQKLELWRKQANKPMAESDDPAVGAAVANAGAPLVYSASINATRRGLRYGDTLGGTKEYGSPHILTGVNPFSKFSLGRPALGPFLGRFQPHQHRREAAEGGGGAAAPGGGGEQQSHADTNSNNVLHKAASGSFSPAACSTTVGGAHAMSAGPACGSAAAAAGGVQQQQQTAVPHTQGETPGHAAKHTAAAAPAESSGQAVAAGVKPEGHGKQRG